jgi:hypothetical protein
MRTLITIILGGALAAGCGKGGDKKDDNAKTVVPTDLKPEPVAADAAPAAGSDVAPEVAGAQEIPAEEDFEEKAAAEVKAENLEDEVKKMEKELVPE